MDTCIVMVGIQGLGGQRIGLDGKKQTGLDIPDGSGGLPIRDIDSTNGATTQG